MNARKQYLEELGKEYSRANEVGRSRLLDEAEKRTGLHRKYLIRVLNHPHRPGPRKRRKRRAEYGAGVVTALVEVWDIFEQPCGQRMVAVLGSELDRLRKLGELRCSDAVAGQLKKISASTIDRLLGREKRVRHLRRNRNPNVQRLIYQKVPVKVAAEWDTSEIGNVQVDFVAHCGRSTGGNYVHTISAVDIATHWWEGQAIAVRSQQATKEGLSQMRLRFPFGIRELHPDNDSALVNDLLWDAAGEDSAVAIPALQEKRQRLGGTEELDARAQGGGLPAFGHDGGVAAAERDLRGTAAIQELLSAEHAAAEQDARGGPDQTGL